MIENKIVQKNIVKKSLGFDLESLLNSLPEGYDLERFKKESDLIHNYCIDKIYERLNCAKRGMVLKNVNYSFDSMNKGELDFAWYDPNKKVLLIAEVKGKESDKKRRKAREQLLKDLYFLKQNYDVERALLVSVFYDEQENNYYVRSEFIYKNGRIKDLARKEEYVFQEDYSPDFIYDKSHW